MPSMTISMTYKLELTPAELRTIMLALGRDGQEDSLALLVKLREQKKAFTQQMLKQAEQDHS